MLRGLDEGEGRLVGEAREKPARLRAVGVRAVRVAGQDAEHGLADHERDRKSRAEPELLDAVLPGRDPLVRLRRNDHRPAGANGLPARTLPFGRAVPAEAALPHEARGWPRHGPLADRPIGLLGADPHDGELEFARHLVTDELQDPFDRLVPEDLSSGLVEDSEDRLGPPAGGHVA